MCICVGCKEIYSSCRAYCKKYALWQAVNGLKRNTVEGMTTEKDYEDYVRQSKCKKAIKLNKSQVR